MLVVLDVNETLLDLSPLDPIFGSRGERQRWFARLIRLALTRTAVGAYRPFGALALDVAHEMGVDLDPERFRTAMVHLPPHPDVVDGLPRLAESGHRLVALGNSAPDVVTEQIDNAGLAGVLTGTFSADSAGALKPASDAYRMVLERTGHEPSGAVMVAAHDWDVAGARSAGMHTAFVDRGLDPVLPGLEADHSVSVLGDLAALL